MNPSVKEFLINGGFTFRENENMARHTTFKIGGNADLFVEADSDDKATSLARFCKQNNIPLTVLGKGSNVLISDDGIRGIVMSITQSDITVEGNKIRCGAGASLTALCNTALSFSLSGLEFAYGIPGSVGGAVLMNAGAYGGEIRDVIVSAEYIGKDGEIHTVTAKDMALGYRESIFKKEGYIILSAEFLLRAGNAAEIKAKMQELMGRRRDKQPLEYPSAGSTFKRPEGYFAGALIEKNGLKGYRIGGAEVSVKHAGFVINKENATALDVQSLIKHIQKTVYENDGVMLEPEVITLN